MWPRSPQPLATVELLTLQRCRVKLALTNFMHMTSKRILSHSFIPSASGMVTLPSKLSKYVHIDWILRLCLMDCEQDELAMVQDNVSSSIIGEMKMQFWRAAVKSLADVRWCFTSRERDLGQTSASPHCSSSTRHIAKYSSSTVSYEENCRC